MYKSLAVREFGDDAAPRIAIRLSTPPQGGYGETRYEHLSATVVVLASDGTIRNLSDRQPLCGVEVRLQMDNGNREGYDEPRAFYAWSVKADGGQYPSFDLARAQALAKCLATVERRLEALNAERGFSASAAEFIARFAESVGTSAFVTGESGPDGTYSTGSWRTFGPAEARYWVAERERSARERMDAAQTARR